MPHLPPCSSTASPNFSAWHHPQAPTFVRLQKLPRAQDRIIGHLQDVRVSFRNFGRPCDIRRNNGHAPLPRYHPWCLMPPPPRRARSSSAPGPRLDASSGPPRHGGRNSTPWPWRPLQPEGAAPARPPGGTSAAPRRPRGRQGLTHLCSASLRSSPAGAGRRTKSPNGSPGWITPRKIQHSS